MPQNVYECMFILDANRYARDPGGVSGRIPEIIERCGGEVLANRLWNEQKLAYPIEGHRKGTYWLTYFRMDGTRLVEFNRQCQLNDNIVRNLVIKVDPRLVEALVAHARGERPAATASAVAAGVVAAVDGAGEGEGEDEEESETSEAS